MAWIYSCPKCGSVVNPGGQMIALVAMRAGSQLLIGFHPEPGNYDVYLPPGVDLPPGSVWSFHCPVCHFSLESVRHANLCELEFDDGGARKWLLFSRICGEHATIVIDDSREAVGHGEHIREYDTTLTITIRHD